MAGRLAPRRFGFILALLFFSALSGAAWAEDPALGAGDTAAIRSVISHQLGAFLKDDQIKTPTLFLCGEDDFNVPTTITDFGRTLYVINAKFGTPPAGTPYEIVKVDGF